MQFVRTRGSPQAFSPRDDKAEEKKIVLTEVLVPVLDYCPRLYKACTSSSDKARS